MVPFLLAIVFAVVPCDSQDRVASTAAARQRAYDAAHAQAIETNGLLIVTIGATWCGPCLQTEANLSAIKHVHLDIEDPAAKAMIEEDAARGGSRTIPFVVVYRYRDGRWWTHRFARRHGLTTVVELERMIRPFGLKLRRR